MASKSLEVTQRDLPVRARWLYSTCALFVGAVACFILGFRPVANVRHLQGSGKTMTEERTPWVWLDYIAFNKAVPTGSFEGYLRLPASRRLWLDNSDGAHVTLTVAGRPLYDGTDSTQIALSDDIPDVAPFALTYQVDSADTITPQFKLALLEESLGIRHAIPAWQFAPAADASSDLTGDIVRVLSLILGLAALVAGVWSLQFSTRTWFLLGVILVLALTVRLLSLNDKFGNDPTLWTMEKIWDNYVSMGRGWLSGSMQVGGTIYQQGTFIYLGMVQSALGPDLAVLYILNTVLGSFAAVVLTLAGWLLFDRTIGIYAGVFTALFAPLIHYQQTLQDTGPVTLLLCIAVLALAGLYRQHKRALSIFCAGLCGLALGLAGAMRSSTLALLALPFVVLLVNPMRWRDRVGHMALVVVMAALCILPITIANFQVGVHALTANLADYQLFRSNNLDSVGMNMYMTQSEQLAIARGDSWTEALNREIARSPGHVVELTVRRIALFWEPVEHSDSGMIDYRTTGLQASPTLLILSLGDAINFRVMMVLAVLGLGLGLLNQRMRGASALIGGGMVLYVASLALFYVIGRVRTPILSLVIPLAALGVVELVRTVQRIRGIAPRQRALIAMVILIAILSAPVLNALAATLPRPTFVQARDLPADLVASKATFGGEIQLLGYSFYDTNYRPGGYLTFELYWKALQKPSKDYVVSVGLVASNTDKMVAIQNFELGMTKFPNAPSSTWDAGSLFDERYLLTLPTVDASVLRSYGVYVGLYDTGKASMIALTGGDEQIYGNYLRLTAVGLQASQSSPPTASPPKVVWGDSLALQDVACRQEGGSAILTFQWMTLKRPPEAMTLFAHLLTNDILQAQHDAPPDPDNPVDAWPPGRPVTTTWRIDGVRLPLTVKVGFYDFSRQRWAITSANGLSPKDNLVEFACGQSE